MKDGGTTIGVFTRAPVPGETKTRLMSLLGAGGAARAHEALLGIALREACAASPGRVTMFVAGDTRHPLLQRLAAKHAVSIAAQQGDELGARMSNALASMLASSDCALVIGSDCAALTAPTLLCAARELARHDLVFVPAEDGGYVLVGARRVAAGLAAAFSNIAWGSADVMATTRQRLAAAGLRHAELPALWDIDTPADWRRALRAGLVEAIGVDG